MEPSNSDVDALFRDKYQGDRSVTIEEDLARLRAGEPLAYVIGWVPFLGLTVDLESHPLIPRPETEWWTEKLITHLKERGDKSFRLLDLCAGSGAIGLSILKAFPAAQVSFGELMKEHSAQIQKNVKINALDVSRADIRTGDLFEPFSGEIFDFIVSNPPYIPEGRTLSESVTSFEPPEALYGGTDGLSIIERISRDAKKYLNSNGELWIEADIENIEAAAESLRGNGFTTEIHTDPYGRQRLLVGH